MGKYEKTDITEKDTKYITMIMNVESRLTIMLDNH